MMILCLLVLVSVFLPELCFGLVWEGLTLPPRTSCDTAESREATKLLGNTKSKELSALVGPQTQKDSAGEKGNGWHL